MRFYDWYKHRKIGANMSGSGTKRSSARRKTTCVCDRCQVSLDPGRPTGLSKKKGRYSRGLRVNGTVYLTCSAETLQKRKRCPTTRTRREIRDPTGAKKHHYNRAQGCLIALRQLITILIYHRPSLAFPRSVLLCPSRLDIHYARLEISR